MLNNPIGKHFGTKLDVKLVQIDATLVQDGPKEALGRTRVAPRGLQDGPKRVQKGAKMTPRGPKKRTRWRKIG